MFFTPEKEIATAKFTTINGQKLIGGAQDIVAEFSWTWILGPTMITGPFKFNVANSFSCHHVQVPHSMI